MYGPGEDAVTSPNLQIAFLSLRTNSPLIITLDPAQNSKVSKHQSTSHVPYHSMFLSTQMTLETDDMDLAGDIVQSLANYTGIDVQQPIFINYSLVLIFPPTPAPPQSYHLQELSSVAEFPHQMSELRSILKQVDGFHKVRQRLTAEMADNSGVIRNLVVRAEDARMMNDM